MSTVNRRFMIVLLEKLLNEEIDFLKKQKQEGLLEDSMLKYAWDLRSSLYDLYRVELKGNPVKFQEIKDKYNDILRKIRTGE